MRTIRKKREEYQNHEPGASADGLWKILWKLEPPKVKVFWWRVVHEFLPARHILWKRHIEPIAFCAVCGAPEESIAHVLLYCTVAREFWHQVRVGIGVKIPSLNTASWASDLISGICSRQDTTVILCGMWTLWMMRNKRRHGELSMSIQQAVTWARDTAYDLWQISHPVQLHVPDKASPRWMAPSQGWFKINSDAAFYENKHSGATASVIRDHRGSFHAAQARWYERGFDVCLMEALACRDGLLLAKQQGIHQVWLETDCLELINLWKNNDVQRSIVDPVSSSARAAGAGARSPPESATGSGACPPASCSARAEGAGT
jgi:hypothetical protein